MNIADQIKTLESAQVVLKDELTEAVKALEAAPDEEILLGTVETLTEKVNKGDANLAALRKAETALAIRAVNAPPIVEAKHLDRNAPKKPGEIMLKHATASLLAFVERKPIEQILEERYKEQAFVKSTFAHIHKTAIPPADTQTPGWAAELVRSDTRGLLDSLKTVSVAAALAARAVSLDFDGFGSVKIPRRNPLGGTLTEPAWVGEGGVIPLTRFSFGSMELFRYKLAAITTYTRELFERSTPSIEAILNESLREAYAEVLDTALLSSFAKNNNRPSGLLYSDFVPGVIAPLPPTAGGGEDAVRGDIMQLVTALTTANLGARPVLLINNIDALAVGMMTSALSEPVFQTELANGTLLTIPVIVSANVPQHQAIIVDAAYLATAFDAPTFDVSEVATVTEANADAVPPTQAGTDATPGAVGIAGQVPRGSGIPVAGGVGASIAGYTARSLWQTYSVGLRMIAPTSWGVMQPGAVAHTTPTTWSA